jgi:hypothetical protein
VLGDQADRIFQDRVGAFLGELMLLGQLAGKLTCGNSFDFGFGSSGHGFLPLGNESTKSPILRYFSQDKGGEAQKNAINWGFSQIYGGKPRKIGLSGSSKAKEPRMKHPRP